jgi:hypothetical protein
MKFIHINETYYNLKYVKEIVVNSYYEITFKDNKSITCRLDEFKICNASDIKND